MAKWLFAVLFLVGLFVPAHARDFGQWENRDPAEREWFRNLKQPDFPSVSCCGDADAYWCDDYYVRDGKNYCRITDDREDGPLGRRHVPIGTEILIPNEKIKFGDNDPQREHRGNPTGHTIVFLAVSTFLSADGTYDATKDGYGVYCFILNSGT